MRKEEIKDQLFKETYVFFGSKEEVERIYNNIKNKTFQKSLYVLDKDHFEEYFDIDVMKYGFIMDGRPQKKESDFTLIIPTNLVSNVFKLEKIERR